MKTVLYHRKTNGTVKIWSCWVKGPWVHSEWGQQDGKMSHTKDHQGTVVLAEEEFAKKVEKRKKKGYVESLDDIVDNVRVDDTTLNFDQLPRSFVPAKPVKQIDLETAKTWDEQSLLYIQRKRDGMRHYVVSDTKGRIRVYSSGKDDMTEHLQPLIAGLKLPPRTILDCELVVTKPGPEEKDGFPIVSGIARSLGPRAQQQIELAQDMGAKVQLIAFDLLWLAGAAVYQDPYEVRYRRLALALIQAAMTGTSLIRMPLVSISFTKLATLTEALNMVKKFKWEGLVLWRKDQATVVQVNGSPKRVNCWKVKPVQEDDVVATGYELGKGKNRNVVGKFNVALYDPKRKMDTAVRGQFVQMGRCGTGLDDATRKAALEWTYPCVIQIEYDQKSEKGFRFPVFIRKRDDKKPSECRA